MKPSHVPGAFLVFVYLCPSRLLWGPCALMDSMVFCPLKVICWDSLVTRDRKSNLGWIKEKERELANVTRMSKSSSALRHGWISVLKQYHQEAAPCPLSLSALFTSAPPSPEEGSHQVVTRWLSAALAFVVSAKQP